MASIACIAPIAPIAPYGHVRPYMALHGPIWHAALLTDILLYAPILLHGPLMRPLRPYGPAVIWPYSLWPYVALHDPTALIALASAAVICRYAPGQNLGL